MPAEVTIRTRTNADWSHAFKYQDTNGDAVSLMGVRLKLNVRKTPQSAEAIVLDSDGGAGIVLTEAIFGDFSVTFLAEQLARLGPGDDFVHDLVAEWPGGLKTTIWTGTLINELGVTRT